MIKEGGGWDLSVQNLEPDFLTNEKPIFSRMDQSERRIILRRRKIEWWRKEGGWVCRSWNQILWPMRSLNLFLKQTNRSSEHVHLFWEKKNEWWRKEGGWVRRSWNQMSSLVLPAPAGGTLRWSHRVLIYMLLIAFLLICISVFVFCILYFIFALWGEATAY